MAKTLSEKVWDRHLVRSAPGEPDLLYIDLHLVHEVTSPQAFDGIRLAGRRVRRPDLTVATADHNVPTADIDKPVDDPISAKQLEVLAANTAEFGITHYGMGDPNQGIVHVIGPEQGRTLPGMTIVCGDSHTSTHGAFGALAFGIGTSEVEHVLATQTLPQVRPGTMAVTVTGELPEGATAKDVILAIIGRIGTGGGIGSIIEYRGDTIARLSMEGRMTICNMSIEAGAKAGLIAPDDVTFAYLEGRAHAPKGACVGAGAGGLAGAAHRRRRRLRQGGPPRRDGHRAARVVGHQPRPGRAAGRRHPLAGRLRRCRTSARARPAPSSTWASPPARPCARSPSTPCSSARAPTPASRTSGPPPKVAEGRQVKAGVRTLVVPGSFAVKRQAEAEGLDRVFTAAGFDWREPGCSMCLAMNPDKLAPGERSASTSNRNFEGRQGRGGRTHLVSPAVAAATAIAGHFALPEDL